MAEREDEPALVFSRLVEDERSFRVLLADPCKPPLVTPCLGQRVDFFFLPVFKIDDNLGIAGTENIIEIPAFYFDNNHAEVRSDYNKIRIPVINIGLVIDEIVIRQFFQKGEGAFLPPARPRRKPVGNKFCHEFSDEPFIASDVKALDFLSV